MWIVIRGFGILRCRRRLARIIGADSERAIRLCSAAARDLVTEDVEEAACPF
jgi:hypothetical protein